MGRKKRDLAGLESSACDNTYLELDGEAYALKPNVCQCTWNHFSLSDMRSSISTGSTKVRLDYLMVLSCFGLVQNDAVRKYGTRQFLSDQKSDGK